MQDLNPHVEARREWNDRSVDLVRARRSWQVAALVELATIGILGDGFVARSLQHKTVPYVVEVDALGAAAAIKPADAAGRPTDERIVRYQLVAFIRGARAVMTDRAAMKLSLAQVYAYARGPARTFLDQHYHVRDREDLHGLPRGNEAAATLRALVAGALERRAARARRHSARRGLLGSRSLSRSRAAHVRDAIQANPFGLYVTEIR